MSRGKVGGSRHYTGGGTAVPYKWTCPACQAENVTPLERGCPSCGVGTPEQNEREHQRKVSEDIPRDRVIAAVVPDDLREATTDLDYFVCLRMLSSQARASIAVGLASHAESATIVSNDELPRTLALAWGRLIMRDVFPEET